MKKIFGLLLFISVAVSSCADDDYPYNPQPGTTEVLLKKMVVTPASNGIQQVSLYNYDGQKLTSVTHSNGTNEQYNYVGDALSDIRYYQDGGLVRKDTYIYSATGTFAGYLASYYNLQNPANNYAERYDYVFTGNTATVKRYRGTENGQDELVETAVLTILNNNIKSYTVEGGANTQYSFDYKNAPLKNVTAYNLIALANRQGGINNQIGRNIDGTIISTAYTYAEGDYPATATVTGGGENYTITYTY